MTLGDSGSDLGPHRRAPATRIRLPLKIVRFLPLALLAVSCGDSGTRSYSIVGVVDSAGVRIVTSAPTDAVYAETAAEPALVIGRLDGPQEYLFGTITAVARDERGNVVVGDSQANEIRVFDATGVHLRTLGGAGKGPGEFETLSDAWPVAGGNIVATDRGLDRITVFDSTGRVVETTRVEQLGGSEINLNSMFSRGTGGRGTVLHEVTLRSASPVMTGEGTFHSVMEAALGGEPQVLYVRHRFDGTLVDTVAEGRTRPVIVSQLAGGAVSFAQLPFAPTSSAAGSDRGIAVTGGLAYELSLFDPAGSLVMIARLEDQPPARTEEHLRVRAELEANERESPEELMEQYRGMPLPDTLPGYTKVRVADTGELWAERFRVTGEEVGRWDVFAGDGAYLGRVEVPASFAIQEISRSQLVGTIRDELDVQRVEIRDLLLLPES